MRLTGVVAEETKVVSLALLCACVGNGWGPKDGRSARTGGQAHPKLASEMTKILLSKPDSLEALCAEIHLRSAGCHLSSSMPLGVFIALC